MIEKNIVKVTYKTKTQKEKKNSLKKFQRNKKDITLSAAGYVIEQSNKIKVLGVYVTNTLKT